MEKLRLRSFPGPLKDRRGTASAIEYPVFGGTNVKVKKGICLLLCILWLICLLPAGALAASGPEASICLTGATEKTLFSADSAIEEQILHPNEQTEARYLLPDGVSYDAPSNTLTLSDYNDPGSTLVLTAMGGLTKEDLESLPYLGSRILFIGQKLGVFKE